MDGHGALSYVDHVSELAFKVVNEVVEAGGRLVKAPNKQSSVLLCAIIKEIGKKVRQRGRAEDTKGKVKWKNKPKNTTKQHRKLHDEVKKGKKNAKKSTRHLSSSVLGCAEKSGKIIRKRDEAP